MRDPAKIKDELQSHADQIREEMGGAPVAVVVGGSDDAEVPHTVAAMSSRKEETRLRDLLGMLQAAMQIETLKHFPRLWR